MSYTREVWEKNSKTKSVKSPIPHSPTNVQWSCQPFRGWGKKRIWHFSKCHPSTKWLARVHHVVVFKRKVLHFKIENTPIKSFISKTCSLVKQFCWNYDKRKKTTRPDHFYQVFYFPAIRGHSLQKEKERKERDLCRHSLRFLSRMHWRFRNNQSRAAKCTEPVCTTQIWDQRFPACTQHWDADSRVNESAFENQ